MSVEELVKRLRGVDHMSVEDCFLQSPLFGQAADKLEELAAENKRVTISRDGYAKHSVERSKECDRLQTVLAEKDKEIAELAAEVERCHARLEIDRHLFSYGDGDDLIEVFIPLHDREKFPDGIEARDVTIREQDEQLSALRKWRQEYLGKLTIAEAALAEAKREIGELRLTIKKIADIKPTSSADHDSIARSWMRDIALSKVLEFTRNAGGKDV